MSSDVDFGSASAGNGPVLPVLLYHAVTERPPAGLDSFTVGLAQFREQIAAIRDSGRTPLTITEIASLLRTDGAVPENCVGVTFDDGFSDTAAAVTALAENNIMSTVFVTSGLVDTQAGMPAADMEHVIAAGGEIGAHTVNHPYLDELDQSALTHEIRGSREQLEQHLGRAVTTFAYPHGAYDRRVRATVIDAQFSSGAAVKNAFSHGNDDPFAIARWTIRADTTVAALSDVLDGHGIPVGWNQERLRTRAFRYARRTRRHLTLKASASESAHVN